MCDIGYKKKGKPNVVVVVVVVVEFPLNVVFFLQC
jgi:hypothetical protein